MTATGGFAIAAGHHRAPAESSGNCRARPLRSPPGVGHSFFLGSDFHPVPGAGFAIPRERQRSKPFNFQEEKHHGELETRL